MNIYQGARDSKKSLYIKIYLNIYDFVAANIIGSVRRETEALLRFLRVYLNKYQFESGSSKLQVVRSKVFVKKTQNKARKLFAWL